MTTIKYNPIKLKERRIKVTGEQIKEFVRGEKTVSDLTGGDDDWDIILFTGGDGYQITLEDLMTGVEHYLDQYRAGTLDIEDFCDNWIYMLLFSAGDMIRLPELMGKKGTAMYEISFGWSRFIDPFFKDRSELAYYVISELFDLYKDKEDTIEEPSLLEDTLLEILEVAANYPENEGKKKADWKLTSEQIKNFVYYYEEDNDLKEADKETIALWKRYLEELAEKEDVDAVRILGYACYGDDHYVYKCDWARSRDCMLKLMEIGDDHLKAQAANTLGYIYYYGRTTKGKPDYDSAYRYFSLAAFFGFYEATYKVGDMIMNGKGTPKNETAAFRLYERVYDDCYPQFLRDGIGDNFADVALRLGSAYEYGRGTYQDLMRAYGYFLQARLAIDNRMKRSDFFGDTSVSASIRNAISDVRKEMGSACRQKKQDVYFERIAEDFFAGVKQVQIKVNRTKKETGITITRMKDCSWYPDPNILVTIPEISYCRLSPEIKVYAPASTFVEVMADQNTFIADRIKPIPNKNRIHFYCRNKLVMAVDMDNWYMKAVREKGSDKMHKFVGICFAGSERVYDYLCDGLDIKVGDYVIVPSYEGPVKVKAVRVYEQSEADAPLEITKYKKAQKA